MALEGNELGIKKNTTSNNKELGCNHQPVRNVGSYEEVLESFKSRRKTLKLDIERSAYNMLYATSTLQYFREDFGGVTCIRHFQDGNRVAIGFNYGYLEVCQPSLGDRGSSTETLRHGWEGNHSISCVRFHPLQRDLLFSSSTAGDICTFDLHESSKYEDRIIKEEYNEINSFDFNADGTMMVTGGKDGTLRIYDTYNNKIVTMYGRLQMSDSSSVLSTLVNNMHEKRVFCVKYNPGEPHMLVSGGWDRVVKLWDTRTSGGWVKDFIGPLIFGESIDINKGKLLTASCVVENSLELWDIGSGKHLKNIVPKNKRIYLYGEFPYTAQFFKGDPVGDLILWGGSGLGGLQVISIKEASILYLFEDEEPVLAVDSLGTKVAFGGKSNSVLFGNIYNPQEICGKASSNRMSLPNVET